MSLSRSTLKFLRALQSKKYRQKYNKFVVEGEKMLSELLRQSTFKIEAVYALSNWIQKYHEPLSSLKDRLCEVSEVELRKISGLHTPNQALAVVNKPDFELQKTLLEHNYCLYLDGIRDPGNMGTILRIADWFGLPYVFTSEDCVELYNPKVIQASMGAFLRVRFMVRRMPELLDLSPQLPVLGAVLNGEDVFKAPLPEKGLLVIGSEAQGISPTVMETVTQAISIPAAKGGGAESLNAGIACGILTAVLCRRKLG